MGTHTGNVVTLANSIVGVSVLAMPFCFKQCGILLAILMLLFSNIITRLACHYLMKSAIMEKRKNFEMLAFRVYGTSGKLIVELCIIGFMLGTCVAYFVIMGDLGPGIIGPAFGFHHPSALRPSVLIGIAVFVVLPLGLLKNVDSLGGICAATLAFYFCLVLKVMGEATNHLIEWDWTDKVYYWRPSGVLQCIPIFSMALSCQTQLFEIFDPLPNNPLDRMNTVVRSAVNMVTFFYIAVGFFGYVGYCDQAFTGNLMMNFSATSTSDVIKIGFLLSVAVSFPLVIFPCRVSIHSLFFSKGYEHAQTGSAHIPETHFKCITLVIVTISLVTGLLIPNIEIVLGLVGSTIGVIVCVIVPGIIFTSLSMKNNNEKLVAKFVVCTGVVIMVLGTYTNLYATEEAVSGPERNIVPVNKNENPVLPKILGKVEIKDETLQKIKDVDELASLPELKPLQKIPLPQNVKSRNEETVKKVDPLPSIETNVLKDVKKEPPVPEEPAETLQVRKEADNPPVLPVAKDEPSPQIPQDKMLKEAVKNPESEAPKIPEVKKELLEVDKPVADTVPEKKPVLPEYPIIKELPRPISLENSKPILVEKDSPIQIGGETDKNKPAKENIIEKIKEHEEAQRKLNEEGAKLLKEIKNYVNQTKDSLKLVNVKTGVVTDLKTNISKISESVKLENKNPSVVESDLLSEKMAKGIPLPLAVKSDKDAKKENEVVEKYNHGRDLLGGDKEIREKRDIEEVLKESEVPSRKGDDASAPRSSPLDIPTIKITESKLLVPKKSNDDPETAPIIPSAETISKLKSDLITCKKNSSGESHSIKNEILAVENKLDELIKAPSFLSDSNSILNSAPQLLSGGQISKEGGIPEMPKKRDLKSIIDSKDDT